MDMEKNNIDASLPTISVVIPVFRSQESLKELYQRLVSVLENISSEFEIIMVEDGGDDGSWDDICKLAQNDGRVGGTRLARNYGQHNALLCGIRKARYEITVTLDDDLQNPPEEIPKLIAKFTEGYDVVYGYPMKEQHGFWRDFASQITKIALQNAMGSETARRVGAFRVFKTKIRKAFESYHASFICVDVLLTWGTSKFVAIPVTHDSRKFGASTYTFSKLIAHAFNMLIGFSILPLQFASMMGFILTLFGGIVFIYVFGRWILQGSIVPGFVFLASIIAIFSGAQLFTLGIMGEYLVRIHFRIMEKPCYVVEEDAIEAKRQGQWDTKLAKTQNSSKIKL